jgi:hypothetical protein
MTLRICAKRGRDPNFIYDLRALASSFLICLLQRKKLSTLAIPFDPVPDALRVAVHKFVSEDRGLVKMLDFSQDVFNVVRD